MNFVPSSSARRPPDWLRCALLDVQAGKQLHHLRDGVPLLLGEASSRVGDAVNDQLRRPRVPPSARCGAVRSGG